MRKLVYITVAITTAALASGCANMSDTQRNTAKGAGVGAVAGAILSAGTGGKAGTGAFIGAGIGALGTYIWSHNQERQKQELEQATKGTGVIVSQTPDNQLKLDIPADISFDTGHYNIKANFMPVLDRFANSLKTNPNAEVRIIGHTDSTGTAAINEPLSIQRAASTREYLVMRGVSSHNINVDGRGATVPIASNETAEGRARNRRVEIFIGERAKG